MPFLDEIVTGLNQKWLNSSLSFIPSGRVSMNGIAETIVESNLSDEDQTIKRFPAIVDNDGEAKMLDVDDSYQLIAFHRIDSIANSIVTKNGYGDAVGSLFEAANMALIVFAFRDKIRKTGHWLEACLKDAMPDKTQIKDKTGLVQQTSFFVAGNSSFDKLALLQREFSEIELKFPNLIVFELKYRIESTYKKGCFQACGC